MLLFQEPPYLRPDFEDKSHKTGRYGEGRVVACTNTMVWRWVVRQETMREVLASSCHCLVPRGPEGVMFSYLVIIKSMTHTMENGTHGSFPKKHGVVKINIKS